MITIEQKKRTAIEKRELAAKLQKYNRNQLLAITQQMTIEGANVKFNYSHFCSKPELIILLVEGDNNKPKSKEIVERKSTEMTAKLQANCRTRLRKQAKEKKALEDFENAGLKKLACQVTIDQYKIYDFSAVNPALKKQAKKAVDKFPKLAKKIKV